MTVTVILKVGNRMFGYSSKVKRDREIVQRELESQYGENIVLLKFRE